MPRRANDLTVAQQRARIDRLHAVNRTRSLTAIESEELQRLVARETNRRAARRWQLPRQIAAAKARVAMLEREREMMS